MGSELGNYHLVFELHPQPMWVADHLTLRFVAVNKAARDLYGWTEAEFLGMTLRDIRPAEAQEYFERIRTLGDDELKSRRYASRHMTKSGQQLDVMLAIQRFDLDGRRVSLGVVTDITGIADVERRFQLLVENSADGIAQVDAQGIIRYMSPGGARILGSTAAELVGTRALMRMHGDDAARAAPPGPGETMLRVQRAVHADGRARWVESVTTNLLHDPAVRAYVSNFRDVTERHQVAQTFRTLIERLPIVALVHRAGKVVYANSAAIAVAGRTTAEQLVGLDVRLLVHPDDHDLIRERMQETETAGLSRWTEVRVVRPDGSVRLIDSQGILLDFDGQPSHVVVAHDITERREVFKRVAVADRLLSVGTLAAGVAHEVNNPLAYVTANLEILGIELPRLLDGDTSRFDRDELAAILRDAQEGASRVSAIVRDLLAFARPEPLVPSPVAVVDVLALAIKMTHNEIRHRARIVQSYDERVPLVYANPSRLGQVFLNLLVNAAHSIEDGHIDDNEIRIRVTSDAAKVHVSVEDTGGGIPADVLPRIFDPFFTTKPPGIGVGLGLSICDRIIAEAGGTITVTSKVGSGSTFTVALPIAPQVELDFREPEPSPAEVRSRILMIDDEAAVGRSIRLLLSPEHDVVPVTRARDALSLLARGERFDVILCDLMMPETSGIEFYDELARDYPEYQQRVVFMTGGAFTTQAREFLASVGTPALEKPFSEQALRTAIAAVAG